LTANQLALDHLQIAYRRANLFSATVTGAHRLGDEEDIASIARLALTKAAENYDPDRDGKFPPYASRLIVQSLWAALYAQETAKRRPPSRIPLAVAESHLAAPGAPEIEATDAADAIESALNRLPKPQADLVRLLLEGLSVSEIAARQGISRAAAQSRLYRAKHHLRQVLRELLSV